MSKDEQRRVAQRGNSVCVCVCVRERERERVSEELKVARGRHLSDMLVCWCVCVRCREFD